MRQLFAESVVLAGAAAVLGLLAAQWTLRTLLPAVPVGDPELLSAAIDARILAFCVVLTVRDHCPLRFVPGMAGLAPGPCGLPESAVGKRPLRFAACAFRRSLVTAQIAVSLLLLVCAEHCSPGRSWP